MMSGLPGTGKSTVARRLATAVDGVQVIATDVVRKELYPQPTYADEENSSVHREVQERLIARLSEGAFVIYDATNLQVQYRAWADVAQVETGCRLVIIETVSAETITRQRLQQRQTQGNSDSDADYEIYLLLKESAEAIKRPHLTIRTDTHFEQDLATAIAALRQAQLTA